MRTIDCRRLAARVFCMVWLWAPGIAPAQTLPVMEAVVGNNFGPLPMFVETPLLPACLPQLNIRVEYPA